MKKPLTFEKLKELSASRPARESFGPNSETPYVAFNLSGSETSLGTWLKDLPCPVIGIGHGALGEACDVVLENDKKLTDDM